MEKRLFDSPDLNLGHSEDNFGVGSGENIQPMGLHASPVGSPLSFSDVSRLYLLSVEGRVRLHKAHQIVSQMGFNREGIVGLYRAWVSNTEYFVLQSPDGKLIAVKCCKRGNDVYARRVESRFNKLFRVPDVRFYKPSDFTGDRKVFTRAIRFTLTFDQSGLSEADAWRRVGVEFNRFASRLRRRFGRVEFVRSWESHESGYPHVEGVAVFYDSCFSVFPWIGKDGKRVYCIKEKDAVVECWSGGFADVKALDSVRGGVRYASKYVGKYLTASAAAAHCDGGVDKRTLTLAMSWFFRKRVFSISGGFYDLIRGDLRNSNGSRGVSGVGWISLGVFSASELGLDGSEEFVELDLDACKVVNARVGPKFHSYVSDASAFPAD